MKVLPKIISVSTVLVLILILGSSCGTKQKMPVTSQSTKAMEYYLDGRDLYEKLPPGIAR